jgi:hypothetical protein
MGGLRNKWNDMERVLLIELIVQRFTILPWPIVELEVCY